MSAEGTSRSEKQSASFAYGMRFNVLTMRGNDSGQDWLGLVKGEHGASEEDLKECTMAVVVLRINVSH